MVELAAMEEPADRRDHSGPTIGTLVIS